MRRGQGNCRVLTLGNGKTGTRSTGSAKPSWFRAGRYSEFDPTPVRNKRECSAGHSGPCVVSDEVECARGFDEAPVGNNRAARLRHQVDGRRRASIAPGSSSTIYRNAPPSSPCSSSRSLPHPRPTTSPGSTAG